MGSFQPKYIVLHDYGGTPDGDNPFNPYHVLVMPDGRRIYRNPADPYGAPAPHAYKLNPESIGIAYGGNVGSTPTAEAMAALTDEYELARKAFPGIVPLGHGEAFSMRGKLPRASRDGRDLVEASWRTSLPGYKQAVPFDLPDQAPVPVAQRSFVRAAGLGGPTPEPAPQVAPIHQTGYGRQSSPAPLPAPIAPRVAGWRQEAPTGVSGAKWIDTGLGLAPSWDSGGSALQGLFGFADGGKVERHSSYGPMFSWDRIKDRLGAVASGVADGATFGLAPYALGDTDAGRYMARTSEENPSAWAKGMALGIPLAPVGAVMSGIGSIGRTLAAHPRMTGAGLSALFFGSSDDTNEGEGEQLMEYERLMNGYAEGGKVKGKSKAAPAAPAVDPLFEKVKGNEGLEALYYSMKAREADSKAAVQGVNRDSSNAVRDKAAAEAREMRTKIVDELMRLNPPKLPFSKAHPKLDQNWPAVQAGIGLAAGAVTRGISTKLANAAVKPWIKTVKKAEDALSPGLLRGARPAEAHRQTQKASEFLKSYSTPAAEKVRKVGGYLDEVAPAGVGALTAYEASALRHRHNLDNAPKDSEEYKAAEAALMGDDALWNAASSTILGGLGGLSGGHLANIYRRSAAPISETNALLRRYAPEYADEAEAFKKSVLADQDIEAAVRAAANKSPVPPQGLQGLPSPSVQVPAATPVLPAPIAHAGGAGSQIAPALPGKSGGSQALPPASSRQKTSPLQTRLPSPRYSVSKHNPIARQELDAMLSAGVVPTKAGLKSAIVPQFKAAKIPVRPTNLDQRIAGTVTETDALRNLGVDIFDPAIRQELLKKLAPGTGGMLAVPLLAGMQDSSVPEPGYAHGGAVDGGGAHAGPLHSTVAGRTDHLPIEVVAGSYVVPADIVSALGEGNTNAGMEVIDQIFPKAAPNLNFAAGGKVPIMAAGGEHVLSPEQVAAIGGGDLDQGHAVLDAWVKQTRRDTIKTLSRLPGPAQ